MDALPTTSVYDVGQVYSSHPFVPLKRHMTLYELLSHVNTMNHVALLVTN